MDVNDSNLSPNTRFDRFLNYRGIKRVNKVTEQPNPPTSRELRRSYNLFPSSDDEPRINSDSDSDLAIFDVDNEADNIDYFRITRNEDNLDADIFYTERRESFGSNSNAEEDSDKEEFIDQDIEYVAIDKYGDRRYSNNSKDRIKVINKDLIFGSNILPINSQLGYANWEFHDPVTKSEINLSNDELNGGIYDSFNPDFTMIETSDPSKLVRSSPGLKFRDSTSLHHLGIKKLFNLENIRKYKNNLATIISDFQGNDYLVNGSSSELVIFDFNRVSHLPNKKTILRFDTRPTFTSTTDRLISTWPYFPHTINFVKTSDNFLGKQVIGVCLDDGTLMIWYTETIISHIKNFGANRKANDENNENDENDELCNDNRFYGLKINPDFRLKMEASLWGLDFLTYNDIWGNQHYLIVASDNSQSISLFYYHIQDARFYHIKSHQILHNIPDVSFLSNEITPDNTHVIKVSCASISGELIVFKFKFKLSSGPLDQDEYEYFRNEPVYYVDPTMEQLENRNGQNDVLKSKRFQRIIFSTPVVTTRTLLGEDCWTAKPINSKFFKNVQSIRSMVGDPWIKEEQELEHIINESAILDLLYDPVKTSHLGLSSNWQFFESPVLSLGNSSIEHHDSIFESAKLTTVDDDYRRIHKRLIKDFHKYFNREKKKSLNGKSYRLATNDESSSNFLLVSTSKKLGLYRSDTLFCNSATKKLFDLSIPFNDESKFSNRISITHIIPELSSFIAVSQQGLITIMRLCHHRGLFGMRQEHIFPNALSLALGYHGYRTICGLAVRNMSLSDHTSRFFIYITYTDGIVIGYELSLNTEHEIMAANI